MLIAAYNTYSFRGMVNQPLIQAFGRRIRQLRTARGLSQEELSFQTGFHRTYIGMVERIIYLAKRRITKLADSSRYNQK